ncbi:MAG: hypothetical protein ABII13_00015 [Patescibacteria group bacterium]|nr:hypothetical protein [Patescibacteria group bacterium]MBU2509093.1 hypothetical protein [Patescibacteria group bacterium]
MKNNPISSFASHVVNQMILLGIGFILWAILFIVWPASFIYLVAAFFIIFGVLSIFYALKIRKIKKDIEKVVGKII